MVIAGWEGEPEDVERRRALSSRMLRGAGAVTLGAAPGELWSPAGSRAHTCATS